MTNETTFPELLPCPFCGSDSFSGGLRTVGHGETSEYIKCNRCGVEMIDEYIGATAGEKWNKRHAEQATATLRAELEQCRADAERLDSRMIAITGRDEFGDPQRVIHYDIDLRAAINAARGAK